MSTGFAGVGSVPAEHVETFDRSYERSDSVGVRECWSSTGNCVALVIDTEAGQRTFVYLDNEAAATLASLLDQTAGHRIEVTR